MKVYGQLEKAALEVLSSDPAQGVQGRAWFNSTSLKVGIDDGTLVRALLRNDQNCVFGNNGTANSNIRLNRAAAGVLQLVLGGDTTAEGSLSANVAQLSARMENYTVSGAPASASANKGRLYFATDVNTLFVDNGTAWQAVGSGGGGGGINWVEADLAPTPVTDAVNNQVYSFENTLGQSLYAVITVPSTYIAGKQITATMKWYSPDASGTVQFQTIATLNKVGDAFNSTTNQRTSTNSAVTMSGANQNNTLEVTFDLTSSTGTINGVAVTAGSQIYVQLIRNASDTATSAALASVWSFTPIFF